MMALLLEAKKLNDRELSGGRTIGPKTLTRLHQRYVEILEARYAFNPEPERRPGQRGRLKRGKPLNLLMRLDERSDEVMAQSGRDTPDDSRKSRSLRDLAVDFM